MRPLDVSNAGPVVELPLSWTQVVKRVAPNRVLQRLPGSVMGHSLLNHATDGRST